VEAQEAVAADTLKTLISQLEDVTFASEWEQVWELNPAPAYFTPPHTHTPPFYLDTLKTLISLSQL
jgi:hypothetical protein